MWLESGKDSQHAKCRLCNKQIKIASGVRSSLASHIKGRTHQEHVSVKSSSGRELNALYFSSSDNAHPSPSSSSATSTESGSVSLDQTTASTGGNHQSGSSVSTGGSSSQVVMEDSLMLSMKTRMAEIRWAHKVVLAHMSFRSSLGIAELFQNMFSDSEIAKQFKMSKTKTTYLINFGLAPYYHSIVSKQLQLSPAYSLSFDESLNEVLQQQQMDVHVRYWAEGRVETRYWNSSFLYSGTADALSAQLEGEIREIDQMKLIHLAMDGPNTNWSILTTMQRERNEKQLAPLIELGSCGLHVVSGAFQHGVTKSNMEVDKLLHAIFKILDKSPARRGEYLQCSVSKKFGMRFCKTRWVENVPVVERAIEMWEDLVRWVEGCEKKPQSKRPQNNLSYQTLVKLHKSTTITIYFTLFRDVSKKLLAFLKAFQTDAPMVPFLADALEEIMRSLMKYVIKKDVLETCVTAYKLNKLDVFAEKNQRDATQLRYPTEASALIKKLPPGDRTVVAQSFLTMVTSTVAKLQERSPLKYQFVRSASALSPDNIVDEAPEVLQLKFEKVVDLLFQHKRLTSAEADASKDEYESFVTEARISHKDKFQAYKKLDDRLDEFLGKFLDGNSKYSCMWKVCTLVFVMYHGQSAVERGFNINSETLVTNLQDKSLTSIRRVYDHIKSTGTDIATMDISKV